MLTDFKNIFNGKNKIKLYVSEECYLPRVALPCHLFFLLLKYQLLAEIKMQMQSSERCSKLHNKSQELTVGYCVQPSDTWHIYSRD